MINIAVIDDERVVRERVVDKVNSVLWDFEAEVSSYGDAASFFSAMGRDKQFHIVISDIGMQGMNGIELGKHLKETCPDVYLIFLTSSADYAVESYMLDAYQYVLKCEMDTRFPEILQSVLKKVEGKIKNHIIVGNAIEQQKVCYEDILYIYKVKGTKYVAYVTDGETLRDRKTLEQVMMDAKHHMFVMIERGHAVNLRHVTKIRENILTLSNGDELEVSRTRIQEVREAINRYWGVE